jgi:dUTP pyrophosphatase
LAPGERKLIPTGISVAIPDTMEIQIRPRSGLAFKNGISVVNTPGTIDSDYRGEIKVLLINHGKENFIIKKFQRIAQMVVSPIIKVKLKIVEELPETIRGEGGFGSTGQ